MKAETGNDRNRRIALRVALEYAFFAALWILFSDEAVALLLPAGRAQTLASTLKGWVFVLVTASILFVVIRRYLREISVGEDALRGSERRLERIFATIPSAVVIIDREGIVTSANHAAERLMRTRSLVGRRYDDAGFEVETLGGEPLSREEAPSAIVMDTGESVYDVRLAMVFADGSRTIVSTNASPLLDEAGEPVAVVTASLDMTGAYTAEQRLVHVNRLYSMVSRTNQAILRIHDEQALYDEVCSITVEYGGLKMAWIGLVDPATKDVRPVAHAGDERGYLDGIHITALDEDDGRGPTGTASRLGRTVVSNDVEHDPYMRPWAERALERGYRSSAAMPLMDETGAVFGVLNVYAGSAAAFDPEETGLLEDLAADLAFGVRHIRRERGLDRPL